MSTAVNDGSLEAIVLKALALNCKKIFFTYTSKGTASTMPLQRLLKDLEINSY